MSEHDVKQKIATKIQEAERYARLGVSATKDDVHAAIQGMSAGVAPNAFCKVLPDILGGDADFVNVAHADGAGTKSILAYLHSRLTGSPRAFRGIAQDAIVMNLDDMLCVGATSGFVLTSVINRNARRVDGAILREIILGNQAFVEKMAAYGVEIHLAGGETADVGDLVRTVIVDATMAARFRRSTLLENRIRPGLAIVGLASGGEPAIYEDGWNSGIGCNGLTAARHELLGGGLARQFPESLDPSLDPADAYCGPFEPMAALPATACSVLDALLSPTRTYAPVIRRMLEACRGSISALVHNTGGGHTKCARFADNCLIRKDLGPAIPAIFVEIQKASGMRWAEMATIFNLGYRMEIYCDPQAVSEIIAVAAEFGVGARQIGATAPHPTSGVKVEVTAGGDTFDLVG
jgi:phosphoribosylformylglycinamidine cyclo-ligase